ncbi:MAG: aldehyde ferredoxin oxidoreductase N-terminal domain-containing protein, partial [Dehalococcoidia bacterium]|nr:aldehyde ferredoxin oxidoreductase N-terminal domain-containing protein [Dehalococcoidia bacterium]
MYGWAGTILRVDLSRGEIKKEPLERDFALKWLGGEGFGAKLLWDEVGPEVEDGL